MKTKRWIHTSIEVGGLGGCGVWLLLQGVSEFVLTAFLLIVVGLFWAWFENWKPKAVIGPSDLVVVNHFRTRRIALEDIQGTLERSPNVTFLLTDGRRVSVEAIDGWYFGQEWNPGLAQHSAAFVDAVYAARDRKTTLTGNH